MTAADAPVLLIDEISHEFPGRGRQRRPIRAVAGVSLRVRRGEVVGVVGESGSGKSTLARCALRLLEPTSGRVELLGTDITHLGRRAMRPRRRDMHMVLQNTLGALNPRMTIGRAVAAPLRAQGVAAAERSTRTQEMLERVGLRADLSERYPHQLSGGQRQRVGIARALVRQPSLLVADEPVSALDVSVRASVLNLLGDLQTERGFACLFISHDLSVVEHVSDHVIVMYLGQVVEEAPRRLLFERPQHPYTQALMSAAPIPDPTVQRTRSRIVLRGDVPSPADPPSGCGFRTRCPLAFERCATEVPAPQPVAGDGGHVVRCHRYEPGGDVPRIAAS
ncbi:ABC transporter ATP-binding protein [Conexibacter woesei]|uniref:Oligopeptide/dipeptide ABC transporter, ATPase subunit n=1 Tax=Conexibacter woesei (strain DSM 14684 / CCUG 47730 / CIP 108061 / JCM 11494 / NBRC 100937 / ID131577) TaxID=469383 RepID=D3F6Y9_CONWI|nr:oligopeptide/dipeptide ABC transporter ATP-binding protein [Conexibacter woesei]ADB52787.1 oligopeptide/dipeptide ABC transporter, ATPase subunit [Conexibacter woesei DSM 14684]